MVAPLIVAGGIKAGLNVLKGLKSFTTAFGGKLTYGLGGDEFAARLTDPRFFRAQWLAQPANTSFWFDPGSPEGQSERKSFTTDRGETMADAYVEVTQAAGLDGLQAIHELYLDTASKVPAGYSGRGEFVAKERDGNLNKYRTAYYERYGAAASQWAGPEPASVSLGSLASVVGSGGMPILIGAIALGAYLLVKK
jgi:hypothetical protein